MKRSTHVISVNKDLLYQQLYKLKNVQHDR